jgi:alkylation response protein AidB-like acyl-CoA dehydrogenase
VGPETLLDDTLLDRIRERAAGYDRDNGFFTEDLEELRERGYPRALVPVEFGGLGWSLEDAVRAQMRLGGAAPATALAINMHLVWTGVAKVLHDRGDDTLDFLLREAGAGELFGFGISEAGNDLMLFGSRSEADPQPDGGYRFTGRKIFTSLSPAWTRLGTMGLDTASADAPKLVYAFIDREDPDVKILDDWNTLGMRASQSRTTVLDGAYAAADRVVRRLDPGPNADPFVFGIFANFELLLAAVYTGIGGRAIELAVAAARRRTSMKHGGRPLSSDPDIRWRIADAAIAHDAIEPQLRSLARDVGERGDPRAHW